MQSPGPFFALLACLPVGGSGQKGIFSFFGPYLGLFHTWRSNRSFQFRPSSIPDPIFWVGAHVGYKFVDSSVAGQTAGGHAKEGFLLHVID